MLTFGKITLKSYKQNILLKFIQNNTALYKINYRRLELKS